MDIDQIRELINRFEGGRMRKLSLKRGDFELLLEKEGEGAARVETAFFPSPYHPPRHREEPVHSKERPVTEQEDAAKYITSPMVGTFYAAPSPGQNAFVKVGDVVEESTVVCVVEAMKVMNEVKAGVRGTISEVLVDNAQPVEFGTKIFSVT